MIQFLYVAALSAAQIALSASIAHAQSGGANVISNHGFTAVADVECGPFLMAASNPYFFDDPATQSQYGFVGQLSRQLRLTRELIEEKMPLDSKAVNAVKALDADRDLISRIQRLAMSSSFSGRYNPMDGFGWSFRNELRKEGGKNQLVEAIHGKLGSLRYLNGKGYLAVGFSGSIQPGKIWTRLHAWRWSLLSIISEVEEDDHKPLFKRLNLNPENLALSLQMALTVLESPTNHLNRWTKIDGRHMLNDQAYAATTTADRTFVGIQLREDVLTVTVFVLGVDGRPIFGGFKNFRVNPKAFAGSLQVEIVDDQLIEIRTVIARNGSIAPGAPKYGFRMRVDLTTTAYSLTTPEDEHLQLLTDQ